MNVWKTAINTQGMTNTGAHTILNTMGMSTKGAYTPGVLIPLLIGYASR